MTPEPPRTDANGQTGPQPGAPPGWEEWARAARDQRAQGGPIPDLSPLLAILESVRRVVPHELQEQFNALQRELLLTIRALIDWYLERLDKPELEPQVEDIPID